MSHILRNANRCLTNTRPLSTTQVFNTPRTLVKMRKLQAHFQCEDGRPIYLKAGFLDRVLYSSTLLGAVLGLCMVIATLYDNAKPASWKTKTC